MSSSSAHLWQRVVPAISAISDAGDLAELEAGLLQATTALGYQRYFVAISGGSAIDYIGTPIVTNWSVETREAYHDLRLGRTDPVVQHVQQSFSPVLWRLPEWDGIIDQNHYDFVEKDGSVAGLAVPMKGPASRINVFSFLSTELQDFTEGHALVAAAVSEVVQARALALGAVSWDNADDWKRMQALSGRQVRIAKWITRGKTNSEIAEILGMNRRTVDYHVAEILKKLNVTSRSQVAALYALFDS